MTIVPTDPFTRGQSAYRVGMPRDAAPYGPDTLEFGHWVEGWDDEYYFAHPSERPD